MIVQRLSLTELLQGTQKFLRMKAGRGLFSVNLEVTRRCNLRCDFCDYWKSAGPEATLTDYAELIARLNPLHLTITGGEPLLRRDLEDVIRSLRHHTRFVYMNLITNGSLLTVDRALALWQAGLNQLSVSLDFMDERHDHQRGRPGLWRHLEGLLPQLAQAGIDNLALNTVIMRENVDQLLEIARRAREWQFKVSFSTYNPFKNNNFHHLISTAEVSQLGLIVKKMLQWKRRYHNITNSDFYLNNIVRYFQEGGIIGCQAGRRWVQVSPDGSLRRCSDKERLVGWREFRPNQVALTRCRECWYACRGEAEAPLGIRRIAELNRG